MIRLEDWDHYLEVVPLMFRDGFKNPVDWRDEIHQEHPILDRLYEQGEFEKYETIFALLGLSYREYLKPSFTIPIIRHAMPTLIADDIVGVQPMSMPTGITFPTSGKTNKTP